MKPLTTSALAMVLSLLVLMAGGCRTTGDRSPGYPVAPRPDYGYGAAYPYTPRYGSRPGYGCGYADDGPYRGSSRYRYPGDNERCNDRRESCQKWSSKRDRYIPDYGETRRQYGKKAERRQRERHAD